MSEDEYAFEDSQFKDANATDWAMVEEDAIRAAEEGETQTANGLRTFLGAFKLKEKAESAFKRVGNGGGGGQTARKENGAQHLQLELLRTEIRQMTDWSLRLPWFRLSKPVQLKCQNLISTLTVAEATLRYQPTFFSLPGW